MQKFSSKPKFLSSILIAALTLGASLAVSAKPLANADAVGNANAVTAPNKTAKKSKSSKAGKKPVSAAVTNAKETEPDVAHATSIEYKCELGNTVVMYAQAQDGDKLSMRWKNHLYQLNRVSTSTGAQRFENQKSGFVWIDIPAKGMLLDSLHGRQLANECKSNAMAMAIDKESGSSTTLAK